MTTPADLAAAFRLAAHRERCACAAGQPLTALAALADRAKVVTALLSLPGTTALTSALLAEHEATRPQARERAARDAEGFLRAWQDTARDRAFIVRAVAHRRAHGPTPGSDEALAEWPLLRTLIDAERSTPEDGRPEAAEMIRHELGMALDAVSTPGLPRADLADVVPLRRAG